MHPLFCIYALLTICFAVLQITVSYRPQNHPCCSELPENLTLAMIIDAFEIYGHDPTDKLDNLWLYQNEMFKIKTAEDQFLINERIHIATDHLSRFINLHIKELKVLLITLDDVLDNMITMYENHNAIAAERKGTSAGSPVPMEFYMSQEFYCGKNVYIFFSELYSDIYNLGKGVPPYCKDRSFVFLGFLHFHDEQKYYLLDDPSLSFPTDNLIHGLECHMGICVFRFPFKQIYQKTRDVVALPKAIVKCGLVMYKLPPLTAASCIISSGSFIFDFNIEGLRFRHHDYLLVEKGDGCTRVILVNGWCRLGSVVGTVFGAGAPLNGQSHTIPNGKTYYTKEKYSPLLCDHHVCEWNYTNHYGVVFRIKERISQRNYMNERLDHPKPWVSNALLIIGHSVSNVYGLGCCLQSGPFTIPGDESGSIVPPLTYIESTPVPDDEENITIPFSLEGCLFVYPPNYGSIAGKSYIDTVEAHDSRFTCTTGTGTKGLYWYPQWMGAVPNHPYVLGPSDTKNAFDIPGPFYPHHGTYDKEDEIEL